MAIDTISRALSGQASTTAKQAKETADSAVEQAISAVPGAVSEWLEDNVTPTTPVVDASLSIAGAAADAKATGDGIANLKSALNEIVDFNYIYNDTFSKSKNIATGSLTNQNILLTDKISVNGGDVLRIRYNIYATINPSIFSSILLQTIEYDANETVLRRTFSYDTPLTLLDNTTKILFAITYSYSNDGAGYSETFEGYVKAQNGDATLNQDIRVPGLNYLLGIVGTDGQPW